MSRVEASTMGAAASKNERASPPTSRWICAERAGAHKGPAAMTQGPSGSSVTSWRTTSIAGRAATSRSTSSENRWRSTASAPPAGTAERRAQSRRTEPIFASSSLRRPAAESGRVDLKEFEHTSSARLPVWCAGESVSGRISCRRTRTPRSASWQAHSQPARPPPMTSITTDSIYEPLSA